MRKFNAELRIIRLNLAKIFRSKQDNNNLKLIIGERGDNGQKEKGINNKTKDYLFAKGIEQESIGNNL